MTAATLAALTELFPTFHARFAPYFFRQESRERSASYLRALIRPLSRKNGWQLAEAMGEADPDGAQRLLYQARWDEDAVRDELQRFVMETLGSPETGVLVIDETGFLKKGSHSVGVARQYSGTAGKVENCQIAVMLSYASQHGAAFLDRCLYVPAGWAADTARRTAGGVPAAVTFQTKPQLARAMLEHAATTGVTAGWVTGDCVYGSDGVLRRWLAQRRQPFVLEVRRTERVWLIAGERRWPGTVAASAADLPDAVWQRRSAGDGSKGPRWYDWTLLPVAGLRLADWNSWLLVRRSVIDPAAYAYYLVGGPPETTLSEAVRVAGTRWTIECCLEAAKGETGLDQYEVRSWRSWQRHTLLSLMAHAFLVWSRQVAHTTDAGAGGDGARCRRRPNPPQCAGNPSVTRPDVAPTTRFAGISAGLVALATTSSVACQAGALPTTRRSASCPMIVSHLRL